MVNAGSAVFLAAATFVVGYFLGYRLQRRTLMRALWGAVPAPDAGCLHRSRTSLKVTQFGDGEDWYICLHCGNKVPASELYGGLEGQ